MSLSLRQLLKRIAGPVSSPDRKSGSAASIAKERLQIIVSHDNAKKRQAPDFMQKLQAELVAVLSKYVRIDPNTVRVQLERHGEQSVLELNITLSEDTQKTPVTS